MRVAYFDCFSGASGDMILAACLGAGLDLEALRSDLAGLELGGYAIEAREVRRQGLAAIEVEVKVDPGAAQPHRHLKQVLAILDAGRLPEPVRRRASAIFTRLAEAEAHAHGTTVDQVHFHEVGAVDAIVDVVGASVAMDRLGVEKVFVSPIPVGSGTVRCAHGLMPVPAPATAQLLLGVPLAECDEPGELITPTGAAILTTLAEGFGPAPAMTLERIGVGAGRREGRNRPNILRLMVGHAAAAGDEESDEIVVLETNLDDVSAEIIGHVCDRLQETGALDVFTAAIHMKKNRPGTLLTVLAPPTLREQIEAVLFAETTTFGVRGYLARRRKLARTVQTVVTPVGPVRIKVGRRVGQVVTVSPEFDDCREAARRSGRPLREVMDLAMQAWHHEAQSVFEKPGDCPHFAQTRGQSASPPGGQQGSEAGEMGTVPFSGGFSNTPETG